MKVIRAIGLILLAAAIAAAGYYYVREWSVLRAAVPPLGPIGQRMLQDLARESAKESTWLSLRRVSVADDAAASKAIEAGEADLALVRSDIALPRNGRSIAVFQTLHVFLVVPPRATIEDFKGLKDRTIAIVPESAANEKLLDLVLSHYGVPAGSVRRQGMKPEDVGPAMQQKKVAAAFVVAPAGGVSTQVLQSVQKAMKGAPSVIGVEDAEAVRRNAIGVDATEVSKGLLGGSPPQPDEDMTTIGVTMRVVVPAKLSTMTAGELTRILFEAKAKALPANPLMREMQQPDSDEKDYPIHPAAQAYFDGESPTFMDRFESLFWIGSAVIGLLGSLFGWIIAKLRKPSASVSDHFDTLIKFLDEVRNADRDQLNELQTRVDDAVRMLLSRRSSDELSADAVAVYSVAIDYARNMIAERRTQLSSQRAA